MRKTDEEIKMRRRERFQLHALRLANQLDFPNVEKYEQLPNAVRRHLENMTYRQMILPLIEKDREDGATLGELARKYSLPKTTVWECLNKKCPDLE